MTTIAHLQPILQTLFTTTANDMARQTGFIQRQRKLTGAHFLQATVFGWLQHGSATRQQLYQSLCLTGATLTAQAFEQRFSPPAVTFLRAMLDQALRQRFEAETLCPILARFQGVYLTDSTRLEGLALKVAARLELQGGQLALSLEALDTHDNVTQVCDDPLPRGALHVGDLGFFDLARFERWAQQGVEWVTRYKSGTGLRDHTGQRLDLETMLRHRRTVTCPVLVGARQVSMMLYARRVSASVLQQRLKRLRRQASRKQRPLSPRRIFLSGWTIYLTSLTALTFEQVHTLYRARWQIECLFKRWKSLGQLAHSTTTDPNRQTCEGLAKLLAVLIAHWVSQAVGWGQAHLSRHHLFVLAQTSAPLLCVALCRLPMLWPLLQAFWSLFEPAHTVSSRQTHPTAAQLWTLFDALP
jgi:hypothetical protein